MRINAQLLRVLGFKPGLLLSGLLGFERFAQHVEAAIHAKAARLLHMRGPRLVALSEEAVLAFRLASAEQIGYFRPQHDRVANGEESAELAIQKVVELSRPK